MLTAIWEAKTVIQQLVLVLLVVLALWRGAAPEKWVAAIFIWLFVADRLYHALVPLGILAGGMNLGHFAIDLIATLAASVIALKANRIYPICFGALQLAALVSHAAAELNPQLLKGAYDILMMAPSYLQILVFAAGLCLHIRRQGKFGPYRSWQNS